MSLLKSLTYSAVPHRARRREGPHSPRAGRSRCCAGLAKVAGAMARAGAWTLLRTVAALLAVWLATGCAALPVPEYRAISHALPPVSSSPLVRLAQASTPDPELSGFRLLPTGPYALSTRAALARRAQSSLDLQYFVFQNDATGRHLMRQMRDAAARGVRVRLLIDDMHTIGLDELLADLAAHAGVEVRLFNPFSAGRQTLATRFVSSALDFYRVNHRMHNKLFIADGAMAVTGGRNIADAYFTRDPNQNFADLDALVMGAAVTELASAFDDYWNSEFAIPIEHFTGSATSPAERISRFDEAVRGDPIPHEVTEEKTDILGYGPVVEELDDARIGLIWGRAKVWVDPTEKVWNCRPTPDGSTAEHLHTVRLQVEQLMHGAQRDVTLSSPYLVPGGTGMRMFQEGLRRGVGFKVLTNSLAATDEPLVHWGYMRYRRSMLNMGVELYELSPTRATRDRSFGLFGSQSLGRLHAKTAVIDEQYVFLGSMNFDPRSDALNTEIGIMVESPELAREVLRLMSLDKLRGSYRVRVNEHSQAIEWVGIDELKEVVLDREPDADLATRAYLWLVAPFISEGML